MRELKLLALDLGTTKFCLGMMRVDLNSETYHVETVSIDSKGMARGMIADFEKAREQLMKLVSLAERQFNTDIKSVAVGISGNHLKGQTADSTFTFARETIVNEHHLTQLHARDTHKFQSDSRELLHVIPTQYKIDRRESTDTPVGFMASSIKSTYYVIDADKSYSKDIVRLCNSCGLAVGSLYSESLASARVSVPEGTMEEGVVIADIGGGTTDGLVYINGKPTKLFSIPIGGKMLTKDLAIGLRISLDLAERKKRDFGLVPSSKVAANVNQNDLALNQRAILATRIVELITLLVRELTDYKGLLNGGVVFTGGGAQLTGLPEFTQKLTNLETTFKFPRFKFPYSSNASYSGQYSTVFGLIDLELRRVQKSNSYLKKSSVRRILGSFIDWVQDLSQ